MKNAMDALGQEIRKDVLSTEVMNGFECKLAFESQLLQKKRREVHPQTPGAFESDIHSYVNPCSEKMGVHERYFHTRLRHTDNFVGQPHSVRALEEGLRSGAPSAKMTKCAYLGLKTLVGTNSCTLLKVQRSGAPSAKMKKTC